MARKTNAFAEAAKNETKITYTENGAIAHNTSDNALVDLYSTIGALRNTDVARITRLFAEAYKEDAVAATKIAFYARDIREGLGERQTFRTILKEMATHYPEALEQNLDLVGVYGRYDDLYTLIGTPLEDKMWSAMKTQFEEDRKNLADGKAISLLAKWIKTADASSKKTAELGCLTAKKLGYSVYEFKRIVRDMRKEIGVIEALMSTGRWDEIKYSEVPSRAMKLHKNAFERHDADRFAEFGNKAVRGEAKINSKALFPYDIIEEYFKTSGWSSHLSRPQNEDILEAQWRQLPNYVAEDSHAIVIADTSGSMFMNGGRPAYSALGLAIYFAERNKGAFKDLFMSFSSDSSYQKLKGNTIYEKLKSIDMSHWGSSTNLEAAFNKILKTAIDNNIPTEEMPKAIVVVSDMEINGHIGSSSRNDWSFHEQMAKKFHNAGYEIPSVIYWNVNSRHDIFHADANRTGVQLVSGQSPTVFKQMMENIEKTAYEAMLEVINSDRYAPIKVTGYEKALEVENDLEEIEL